MSGEGHTTEGQCAIGDMQDDVKDGKKAGGASIQNTEHKSPPSPSGGTCSSSGSSGTCFSLLGPSSATRTGFVVCSHLCLFLVFVLDKPC